MQVMYNVRSSIPFVDLANRMYRTVSIEIVSRMCLNKITVITSTFLNKRVHDCFVEVTVIKTGPVGITIIASHSLNIFYHVGYVELSKSFMIILAVLGTSCCPLQLELFLTFSSSSSIFVISTMLSFVFSALSFSSLSSWLLLLSSSSSSLVGFESQPPYPCDVSALTFAPLDEMRPVSI